MAAIVCDTGGGGGARAAGGGGGGHASIRLDDDRGSGNVLACSPKALGDAPAAGEAGSSEPAASDDVEYIPLAAAAN